MLGTYRSASRAALNAYAPLGLYLKLLCESHGAEHVVCSREVAQQNAERGSVYLGRMGERMGSAVGVVQAGVATALALGMGWARMALFTLPAHFIVHLPVTYVVSNLCVPLRPGSHWLASPPLAHVRPCVARPSAFE